MQGLVLDPNGQFHLEDVPAPQIGHNPFSPYDVLVEVAYCGICGSDIHKWKESDRRGVKGPSKPVVSQATRCQERLWKLVQELLTSSQGIEW